MVVVDGFQHLKTTMSTKSYGNFGLVGAGLAYLGTVVTGSSYTFENAMLVFIPLLVGFALYAYCWGANILRSKLKATYHT